MSYIVAIKRKPNDILSSWLVILNSDTKMSLNIQNFIAMSIVLLWFFTAYISYFALSFERLLILKSYLGLVVIFVPIAGWIGDTYLGRYRVIKYSMRILWVFLISCEVIITFDNIYEALSKVLPAIVGIGAVASVGILANIIQFGMDQLPDASSTQISGFIQWSIWIMYLTEVYFFCQLLAFVDCIQIIFPCSSYLLCVHSLLYVTSLGDTGS